MNDAFSDKVQPLMEQAREEAARLGHNYLGTEHLLLGLIQIECSGARILTQMGLILDQVKQAVDDYVISSGGRQTKKDVPFTPRAKNILVIADDEAKERQSPHVGTRHILLALAKDEDGVAAQILDVFNIDYGQIKKQITDEDS
jgi:ATP-dependent Clp protease ATP-binding subunit ClpC